MLVAPSEQRPWGGEGAALAHSRRVGRRKVVRGQAGAPHPGVVNAGRQRPALLLTSLLLILC